MSNESVVEEFRAIFRGGLGPNNNIKWSYVKVKILTGNQSKYKYIGRKKLSSLWNGDWYLGPTHLDKEDYIPIDMDIDGEFQTVRIYNISLFRDKFVENLQQSSMEIKLLEARTEIDILNEQLANALAIGKDSNMEDKRKAIEIENADHYKTVRSKLSYVDSVNAYYSNKKKK